MNNKQSLKKLYGWVSQNLEDTSKKTEQIIPKNNLEDKHIFLGGNGDDGINIETIQASVHNILYKYNGTKISQKKGSKSKISISYHKPKCKIFFGSKTTKKKYNSKHSRPKTCYGQKNRNYNADINIKQLKKLATGKIKKKK